MRSHKLKFLALLIPILLSIPLIIRIHVLRKTLRLRNHFLLESLSSHSNWIWDSMSAQQTNELYNDHVLNGETQPAVPGQNMVSKSQPSKVGHGELLGSGLPPLVVHYLWCIDGHFELTHYISVLSIVHQLRPNSIVIHYRTKPRSDPKGYWRWLEDLQRDIVFLTLRPLSNPKHCSHTIAFSMKDDPKDFHDSYGVFILGNVVVSNLTRSSVVSMMASSLGAYVYSNDQSPDVQNAQLFLVGESEPYQISEGSGRVLVTCPSVTQFNTAKTIVNTHCIDVNAYVYPEELFRRDLRFFRFARNLLYGSPSPVDVTVSVEEETPRSVHLILATSSVLTPLQYASIKSAYLKYKADHVFIHGPEPPSGELWDRLLQKDDLRPCYIPTAPFDKYSTKHGATIYALYTLVQHGGLVHYGDVLFANQMSLGNTKSVAVASLHRSQYRMKHRLINTNVMAASRGANFVETLLAMTRQADQFWPDASVDDMATHINEQQPSSVRLDSLFSSQLSCDLQRCDLAGGYGFSSEVISLRLIFKSGKEPSSLLQLRELTGVVKTTLNDVIGQL